MNEQFIINMEAGIHRRLDAMGQNQDGHFRYIEKLLAVDNRTRVYNLVLMLLFFILGLAVGAGLLR